MMAFRIANTPKCLQCPYAFPQREIIWERASGGPKRNRRIMMATDKAKDNESSLISNVNVLPKRC